MPSGGLSSALLLYTLVRKYHWPREIECEPPAGDFDGGWDHVGLENLLYYFCICQLLINTQSAILLTTSLYYYYHLFFIFKAFFFILTSELEQYGWFLLNEI